MQRIENETIGYAARQSGCAVSAIRYYEEIGLLGRIAKGSNGRRTYNTENINRLKLIRYYRELNMGISAIQDLLKILEQNGDCEGGFKIMRDQIKMVNQKISKLEILKLELSRLTDQCLNTCCGSEATNCNIFSTSSLV